MELAKSVWVNFNQKDPFHEEKSFTAKFLHCFYFLFGNNHQYLNIYVEKC